MAQFIFKGSTIRLDIFLFQENSQISRSQWQKRIANGEISVNGKKITKSGFILHTGDSIEYSSAQKIDDRAIHHIQLNVIFENENYFIIDKPAGLLVYPTATSRETTLVDMVKARYPVIQTVGGSPLRPGIVHRLDRDVSGVMIVAKTQQFFEYIKSQFQEHNVYKEYVALVWGVIKNDRGEITLALGKRKKDFKVVPITRKETKGVRDIKSAHTFFEVIKRLPKQTLARIVIITGRTHQIRVHFKSIEHPIVGDRIYTTKPYAAANKKYDRIYLHSHMIRFRDQDGREQEYQSPSWINSKYEARNSKQYLNSKSK